ncbi:sodium-coupled monocarboxylate transporter 2-like [Rhipicephalus sanguineus]|uniref:sodium-coupled monocarboxylate transporter 2-like n=1 Tax=Rhipicephalus sanguineus TaxID=34632 RepID=UPI0020C545C4|nr:sodium-coupled monocarboxylate transporter 2-like [Rhipicephalus sanguineus]
MNCAGTGLYLSLRRRSRFRSKDETFLGSRTIHTLPLALSMVASNVSASGLIAFTAHYYVYGFHTLWAIPVFVPAVMMVAYLFLPVLYELKVTSVFEYLRMRYGNGVGVASSVIYFVLSQAIGVAGLYSAAIAISTVLEVSTVVATVIVGVAGTGYTALGGLRSVVWADCVQTLIMTASPLVIITKIAYDASGTNVSASSREKLDVRAYIFRTDLDLTTDETVWAASVAAFPYQLLRLGLDQMITQRFLAARTLREARVVTFIGAGLLALFYALGGFTALAIVFWFRGCDPYLSGSISRYDQIVPYYINKSASAVAGVRGLFLAGVVSASISTMSSIVNSQAAVLYVDIVSPKVRVSEKTTPFVVAGLAVTSGTVMTLFGLAVPYAGSAARFCISLYSSASGPFAGIMILAFMFPWANARGTATAALAVFLIQTWQTTGRFLSRIEPRRMSYSVEQCPLNSTVHETDSSSRNFEASQVFLLYRLSPYWCCLLSACATVLLGLVFSLLIAGPDDSLKNAARLSTPATLKFWQRIGLLQHLEKEAAQITVVDPCFKVSPFELQPLHESQGGHRVPVDATRETGVLYKFTQLAS